MLLIILVFCVVLLVEFVLLIVLVFCVVFLVEFVLLIILVFCVLVFVLFVFVLCLVHPKLPVSLDCPFLIFPSGFSNVYYLFALSGGSYCYKFYGCLHDLIHRYGISVSQMTMDIVRLS